MAFTMLSLSYEIICTELTKIVWMHFSSQNKKFSVPSSVYWLISTGDGEISRIHRRENKILIEFLFEY